MGARANIQVDFGKDGSVYLYSHWAGEDLAVTLKRALSRNQRWDDGQYLTRIIFEEMIKDNIGSETGFGISPAIGDNEYPVIRVDLAAETVTIGNSPYLSFKDYCAAADDALRQEMKERAA